MAVATAHCVALEGAIGHLIDVQVDVSQGVVVTSLVGRPDASINEARDRCRTAISNSGFDWPATRRVTILLSPADLPKRGTHFDLAIAVGVLAAADPKNTLRDALEGTVMIGELTLDGRLRTVPGVLAMTMAASARGFRRVFVPEPQSAEAALVPGMSVFGFRSLAQVIAELRGLEVPDAPSVDCNTSGNLLTWQGDHRLDEVDMADIIGMDDARYAMEVAAAGGHHLMLTGPKGAGKTSLAERIPGILPDLALDEALELTAILSLSGVLDGGQGLITKRPFFAPHHSASRVSLLGGGTGRVRPGEISRAHHGVLFLDEFPLFNNDIIEALRQPLESGEVTIARGEETATYPARGMFVLACNPCRCGNYSSDPVSDSCKCKEVVRRDYRLKLEGPVMDRIDITRHVRPVPKSAGRDPLNRPESSSSIRARVTAARRVQTERYAGLSWRINGQAPGPVLRDRWPLTDEAATRLDEAIYGGEITRRGGTRVHRLAWTVADLAGVEQPGLPEVETALALRTGQPLALSALSGRAAG
ncbi:MULTISPECIES: YifB family Mg chelatase-like AAA ATPase [unclassified Nocardioides]|uniref:YifB family Mg chelatase-like AAA ATPase n=1 Tax=unclassified Nocardioides TaxID=2615069 RepID=UPI0006F32519|nr:MULTISPECIES: YifB family Mg chelatase-like AAA ATPase [unclassified Nocardioides]KQY63826.1 magnesium chelatase [Nocardioides sp. Root140]KQZ69745.1 magnesium chelatase [Nocardioides sp. Root151]